MQTDWGQRATQRHDWCWVQGMRACLRFDADAREPDGALVLWGDRNTFTAFNEDGDEREYKTENATPNMHDAATQGCVLALMRKAWGADASITIDILVNGVTVINVLTRLGARKKGASVRGSTFGEALILAWEAAP